MTTTEDPKTTTNIDAFTAEVFRNALVAITRQMKVNLQRTAYNTIIYEAEDFTVGLFDAEGNTISIGLGLPMFIRGLSDAIKAKIAHWGLDDMQPGDVLLTNDPYVMGSHLNHMIFTVPVFHDGEIVAFSSSMAHWPDVGGSLERATRDIYSEGIQFPFVKIYKGGKIDKELESMIRANCRFPERAMGDFRAQIAAIRTGERRLMALLERYGTDAFKQSVAQIFDASERIARTAVEAIPDGVYEADSFMDDDGINIGKNIPIKVKVIVQGDEMTVDFTDVAPQVAGYFNSGPTAGRSAAQVAFKCMTTPLLLPINDGALRPLKIILPPGRFISAQRPAAMRMWMTYPMTVVDTIFKAISQVAPERVIAGHHADLVGIMGGGWGAKLGEDGMSATICINDGDTHNSPIEATEAKNPHQMIAARALRPDSGGNGQWRGGLGITMQSYMLEPMDRYARARRGGGGGGALLGGWMSVERTQCAPWGLNGGLDAMPNRVRILRKDGSSEVAHGKGGVDFLDVGEGVAMESGGGGGFGDPLLRPVEKVYADVRGEYVSIEAARRDYGVVVTRDRHRYLLDEAATAALRAEMQATRGKTDGTATG